MNDQQAQHLDSIVKAAEVLIRKKYTAGAAEHGDTFRSMKPTQLVDEILGEVTDLLVYTIDLAKKLNDFKERYHDSNGTGPLGDPLPQADLRPLSSLSAEQELSEREN